MAHQPRENAVPCRMCSRGRRSKLTVNVSAICDDCIRSTSTEQKQAAKTAVRMRLIRN